MSDLYVQIPIADDDLFDEVNPRPSPSVLVTEYGTDRCYLYTGADIGAWPVSASVLAAFDRDTGLQAGQSYDGAGDVQGTPTYPIQATYWSSVRPLGNEAGRATGPLRTLRWQGMPEERYAEAVSETQRSEYPSTDVPFTLEIIRQDYGSEALPWDTNTVYAEGDFATSGGMWRSLQDGNQGNTPFGGSAFWEFINQSGPWGWVVKMISADPGRDIAARAIGVYSDPEATSFLFQTGSFINDGKYGDVFYTECPPGNRTATADPVYFALLLGAAQEGIFQLDSPDDGSHAEALFWAADQP